MSKNLTRAEGLVEELSETGWLSSPEGEQGFAVLVFKKTKIGKPGRCVRTLMPGENLDFGERFWSNHIALKVDLRAGRHFTIEQDFDVYEPGRSVNVKVNVRYRVTDVNTVAIKHVDPLGELQDEVIATLNGELKMYKENSVTSKTIEGLIRGIQYRSELGLMIEGVKTINFKGDPGIINAIISHENLDYQISVDQKKLNAELDAKKRRADVDRQIKDADQASNLKHIQQQLKIINLTDPNHLMQLHSNIIPQILASFADRDRKLLDARIGLINQAVEAYIRDQNAIKGEVNPQKIAEIMNGFLPSQSNFKRLADNNIFKEDAIDSGLDVDDDIFLSS